MNNNRFDELLITFADFIKLRVLVNTNDDRMRQSRQVRNIGIRGIRCPSPGKNYYIFLLNNLYFSAVYGYWNDF